MQSKNQTFDGEIDFSFRVSALRLQRFCFRQNKKSKQLNASLIEMPY
jgi:hypothetical protein